MECIMCGKPIENSSVYCNFCGAKQVPGAETTAKQMLERVKNRFESTAGYALTESGILKLRKLLCEFGFEIIDSSVETALIQYLEVDEAGRYTQASSAIAFSKIGGIARNKYDALTKPYIADARRILKYASKAFYLNYYETKDLIADINNLMYYFYSECPHGEKEEYNEKVEMMLMLVRGSKSKYDFFDKIEDIKEKCGLK